MSGYVWDLSGTDEQCDSYGPGHQIHWIQFNHSMREPSAVIPVAAVVDDEGLVHIEGDDLSLVRWNHRPALVRAALERSRGFARWKPRWHISLSLPNPSSAVRAPCSAWRPWTKGENATFIASPTLTT